LQNSCTLCKLNPPTTEIPYEKSLYTQSRDRSWRSRQGHRQNWWGLQPLHGGV